MKNLLIGILGGLSLGMLFAPEKGKKLREKLAQSDHKLQDFGNALISAGKDASSEVRAFLDSEEVVDLIAKGKINADELLKKGIELSEQGKEEVKSLVTKASEEVKKKLS